ncbi:MAG TPA: flagellar hook-basal body protein [Candidatus Baltobacteraceae bacterium]
MNRALYAAASGMAAQQMNLDTISDNLANADVAGFKGATMTFADIAAPGESGLGTQALGERTLFGQGKLEKSGGAFDVAIDGPGFFILDDGSGRRAYTRDGEFARAADGTLRNAQGWRLEGVRVPQDAISISVDERGGVIAATQHGPRIAGHIGVAEFAAPDGLAHLGGTIFRATPACGAMHVVMPGAPDGPSVKFGMLERSNVSIVEAMMQILSAQRAYEANAKGVQAADEMMRIGASPTISTVDSAADPHVTGAFEALLLAPMFSTFEQSLGPVASTVFESTLANLLERGDG